MQRPVWLFSMDSDQFNAPPTTTAALTAYFRRNGRTSSATTIELVHFQCGDDIAAWLEGWRLEGLPQARRALENGLTPVAGLSFYTWNAAEFLALAGELKRMLPELLIVAGGPHVQQAADYLGVEPIDVVFLGEAEISFQEFLDCRDQSDWPAIHGLAFLDGATVTTTPVLFDDVADLAIALGLAVCRQIPQSDAYVRSGAWLEARMAPARKFSGHRAGVLGLGRIGSEVARRLEGFKCQISYFDPAPRDVPYRAVASALELAEQSDILYVCAAGKPKGVGEPMVSRDMIAAT